MRLIKMLGLAVITALAALTFLGASSASAGTTAVCTNEGNLTAACTGATKVHFVTVGHMVLLGPINIECSGLLSAETDDLLAVNGPIVFDKNVLLHYTGCLGGCSINVVKQGSLFVLKTGVELADVTGFGFEKTLKCFGLGCDYDWINLVGHGIRSAGESHITYDDDTINIKEKLGGFITCPSTGALDALFRALSDIFIRA